MEKSSIKSLLIQEHSKKQSLIVADLIIQQKLKLSDLIAIIKKNEALYAQRAAWVLAILSEKHAQIIQNHAEDLMTCLNPNYHDAVLRACYKSLSRINIPEKIKGELFEKSITFLSSKKTATGIKTWVIDVLANISKGYPELQNEIKVELEMQINHCEIGIKGKMRKTIEKINLT